MDKYTQCKIYFQELESGDIFAYCEEFPEISATSRNDADVKNAIMVKFDEMDDAYFKHEYTIRKRILEHTMDFVPRITAFINQPWFRERLLSAWHNARTQNREIAVLEDFNVSKNNTLSISDREEILKRDSHIVFSSEVSRALNRAISETIKHIEVDIPEHIFNNSVNQLLRIENEFVSVPSDIPGTPYMGDNMCFDIDYFKNP